MLRCDLDGKKRKLRRTFYLLIAQWQMTMKWNDICMCIYKYEWVQNMICIFIKIHIYIYFTYSCIGRFQFVSRFRVADLFAIRAQLLSDNRLVYFHCRMKTMKKKKKKKNFQGFQCRFNSFCFVYSYPWMWRQKIEQLPSNHIEI